MINNVGGISTNILNKNTVKTWESLDEWIEQGNEICTNSLSLVMMRTQQTRQKGTVVEKDKDRDKDREKEKGPNNEVRSRERGTLDESTDEFFIDDRNEFQKISGNYVIDDKFVENDNGGNENEIEDTEEEIMKNVRSLSDYFHISENELNILCKKISKSNIDVDSASTKGHRVRDERGSLLRSCVFDTELPNLLESCLLDKEDDIFVVATGKSNFICSIMQLFFLEIVPFQINLLQLLVVSKSNYS